MKKYNNIAIAVLMALGVTACSGGNSSSNPPNAKPEQKQPEQQPQKPDVPPMKQPEQQPQKPDVPPMKQPEQQPQKPDVPPMKQPEQQPQKPDVPPMKQPEQQPQKPDVPPMKQPEQQPQQPDMPPMNRPNIEMLPEKDNVFSENANYKGTGFIYPREGGPIKSLNYISQSDDINYLHIDVDDIDYQIEIFPKNYSWTYRNASLPNGGTLIASKNENTLWALVNDSTEENIYLITHGVKPTSNMDSLSGEVKYSGSGFHSYVKGGKHDIISTKVEMNVDFSNKVLTGTVNSMENNEFKPIHFGANITKNAFQGKLNNVTLEGGFFGDNAKEAIGRYEANSENASGVFGVKKQ